MNRATWPLQLMFALLGTAAVVLAAWLVERDAVFTWGVYLLPLLAALLAALLFKPRLLLYVLLLFPLLVAEVSNDTLFASSRTPVYAYKLFGLANVYDFLFFALVAVWLLGRIRDRRLRFDRPFDLPLLGFLAVTTVALVSGLLFHFEERRLIFFEFINITRFAWIYFLTLDLFLDLKDYRRLLKFWFLCAAAVGFMGLFRFLSGAGVDLYGEGHNLIFVDPGFNALLLTGVLAVVGLWGVRSRGGVAWRYWLLLLPALVSLIFSYRRGIWLGTLTGAALLWLLAKSGDRWKVALNTAMLTLLAVLFIFSLQPFQPKVAKSLEYGLTRVQSISELETDASNIYRVVDMQNAWESIRHYPLLGLGLGGYYAILYGHESNHAYRVAKLNNVSHNTYLFLWMKMGLFSLACFLWLMIAAVRLGCHGLQGSWSGFQRQAGAFSLSLLVTFLLVLVTGPLLLYSAGAVIFGANLAFLTRLAAEPGGGEA